jgi:hypothetical protein
MMLRRMFLDLGDEINRRLKNFHDEELHDLQASLNNRSFKVIKSRMSGWWGECSKYLYET